MKKLLYISKDDRSKELRSFFDELNSYGLSIDVSTLDNIDNRKGIEYDYILIHHNRQLLTAKYIKEIAKKAMVIYWVNDERHPLPSWIKNYIDTVDLFLVASNDSVKAIRKLGGDAEYLIMGFNPKDHFNRKRNLDVVFTGQNSGNMFPLSATREEYLVKLKKAFGDIINIHGKGWGLDVEHAPSGIYGNAKIGINIGHYSTEWTYSNRVLQIMSNGALALIHDVGNIREIFGDNAVYFKNYKELGKRINHYLLHEEERERIAMNGYNFVNNNLTWKHKADNIIKMIAKYDC